MSIVYCKYCGTYQKDTAKYCSNCGKIISREPVILTDHNLTGHTAMQGNTELNNINGVIAVAQAKPKVKLEDGFFFKEVGLAGKIAIYALGVFIAAAVAALIFAAVSPGYFDTFVSYMSRFFA